MKRGRLMVDNPYHVYFYEKKDHNGKVVKVVCLFDKIVADFRDYFSIKTIYLPKGEEVWCYNEAEGIWEKNGREVIKSEIEYLLGKYCKIGLLNEVFDKIKRQTAISREEFDNIPVDMLCLKNGIINVKTKELIPFSPKYFFKTKLNISYVVAADCPKIKSFLEEVLYPDDIPTIQEWFGFHLYKKHFIKKVLLAFGEKDTGKTIFLKLLVAFVGERNKTGISLQSISKGERFVLAFLKDKLANVYDDLKQQDIKDTGGLKIATGGSYVTGEYKFGEVFQFLIYSKNTFATNKIPEIKEIDMAYYDRFLPISFDNVIPKKLQDNFLYDKLTTDEEMSGLLNWALEGLGRLLKKGQFSFKKNADEIKVLMESHSNGISAFCNNCLEEKKGSRFSKELMYELYRAYCIKNTLTLHSKELLGRRLGGYLPYVIEGAGNFRSWSNVGLKEDCPEEVNDTYDTFNSNIYTKNKDEKNKYMIFPEASYPSSKDTYDTNEEEETKTEKIVLGDQT